MARFPVGNGDDDGENELRETRLQNKKFFFLLWTAASSSVRPRDVCFLYKWTPEHNTWVSKVGAFECWALLCMCVNVGWLTKAAKKRLFPIGDHLLTNAFCCVFVKNCFTNK